MTIENNLNQRKKPRVPLSLRMNLILVSIILLISGGLLWISYRIYANRVDTYYYEQAVSAAKSARDRITPEVVLNIWKQTHTDEFRAVRDAAKAADDERMIRNWMAGRPSGLIDVSESELWVDDVPVEFQDEYGENAFSLWWDFDMICEQLQDCMNLFNITGIRIQYEENHVTYNIVDPSEPLFTIASVEGTVRTDENHIENEGFLPVIHRDKDGWFLATRLPLNPTFDGDIVGFVEIDTDMDRIIEGQHEFLINSAVYVLSLTLLAILLTVYLNHRIIIRPLQDLARSESDFGRGEHAWTEEEVLRVPERTNDEIDDLYHETRKMQLRIIGYTENLTRITAERERVAAELQTAESIQRSMLPDDFPAFPDRSEFDLYASMTPAKEVGGDYYDFFLIDEDHLALVIADVSDKGIPAALFMMSTMILIRSRTRRGGTPAEILGDVNREICSSNRTKMFVTVWLGILDLKTGQMLCANAGHEYPFIRTPGGPFTMLRDKHGLVIGGLEKSKYTDYEITLEPGGALFVYTDGVPEAADPDGKFYGMERLGEALSRAPKDPEGVLKTVKDDVDAFVNGAKQFDDLTMLSVTYNGPASGPAPES